MSLSCYKSHCSSFKSLIMKKLFLLFSVAFLSVSFLSAQTVDEILAKYFKASGTEILAKKKTIVMKGNMSQMDIKLPMVIKVKHPNKFRIEMEMQGQKMVTAFDGEHGWMIAPWISQNPQDLAGKQLEQTKEQADMEGELYRYKEKGHKATYMGKEEMEGIEVYKIKLDKKNGNVQYYYIDTDVNLPVKVSTVSKQGGNEVKVNSYMSNYKTIDGVTIPMSIENKVEGTGQTQQVEIESILFDQNLPDSIFLKPVK